MAGVAGFEHVSLPASGTTMDTTNKYKILGFVHCFIWNKFYDAHE